MAFVVSLALIAALGALGGLGVARVRAVLSPADYASAAKGEVIVQVRDGQTATDIANTLTVKGVVKSPKAFINAANATPDSRTIEVGYYRLHPRMPAKAALAALLARSPGGSLINRVSHRVTIPEGTISIDAYALLAKGTNVPVAELVAAAKDPAALGIPDWWFTRDDGKAVPHPPSIEGFLYPDTYDFDPGVSATDIMRQLAQRFLAATGAMNLADAAQSGLRITPYEALVAASIAQVEAVTGEDMAGVARVLYNRAYGTSFPCRCLGLDSEVNYWLRISGQQARPSGALTQAQLHDPADPYNTHDRPGLPIGPISNPGKVALAAAMSAPRSDNLYFLGIDTAGHMAFAQTYDQFCALVRRAAANGVPVGAC